VTLFPYTTLFRSDRLIDRGLGRLYIAYEGDKPIAGAFFAGFNRKTYYMLSAANGEGLQKAAPDLVLWTALTDYLHEGYKLFNFGGLSEGELNGSPLEESGLFHFKKRFSSQERLCYKGYLELRPRLHTLFQVLGKIRVLVSREM
jgi:lipid II:glycine glycyltransferase (peptidoglycan interpeptide bridge formation enzyme)